MGEGFIIQLAVLSMAGAFDADDVIVHLPSEGRYVRLVVFNKGVQRS